MMTTHRAAAAAISLVLVTAACGGDDDPADRTSTAAASSATAAAAGTSAPVDGFSFTAPDGSFSVVLPGEPEEISQDAPMPDGSTLPLEMWMYETSTSAHGVSTATYAQGTPTSLEGARDGAVSNVGGQLVRSEPITLQGRQGLDFEAALEQGGTTGTYRGRIFLDGLDLYQLVVVGAEGELTEEDVDAFFESFRFAEG